ncbi:hypothetical protein BTHI11S_06153 [Bosea thiooxidans]
MQPFITDQSRLRPRSTSSGAWRWFSLARFICAIESPLSRAMRSIAAAFANG